MALPATAPAATGGSASTQAQRVGSFDATGIGVIGARGNFTAVFGRVRGGSIVVRDVAGNAVVKVKGVEQRPTTSVTNGTSTTYVYRLRNVRGAFYVSGRRVFVTLQNRVNPMAVSFIGRGSINRLEGRGTFRLNGSDAGGWASAVLPMAITPPPVAASAPLDATSAPTPAAER